MHNINVSKCIGITQDPTTQDFMIIMEYYESGDLAHYITREFSNISWSNKLDILLNMTRSLNWIHGRKIIHRDYHSGNVFIDGHKTIIGDLGISKSAIESSDDDDEIYGIISYVAPEV